MTLLELSDGGLSIEFEPEELDHVNAALGAFGNVTVVARQALFDTLEIGDATLTYYHEWDPCLIGSNPAGRELLRQLVASSGGAR